MKISTCVVACITSGEHVLLTHRTIPPFKDTWVLPGGKIDFGESIEEALKREVMEEIGIEVKVGRLLGVFEHPAESETGRHYITLGYECKHWSGVPKPNGDECDEYELVHRVNLGLYDTPPGTSHILKLLEGK